MRAHNKTKRFGKSTKPRKGRDMDHGGESGAEIPRPSALVPQLNLGTTLRFITTSNFAANGVNVTVANLLDAWLIAGTTSVGYQLFDFVRVKAVRVWSNAAATASNGVAASCNVSVNFPGLVAGGQGSGKYKEASNMGSNTPAFLKIKPDAHSLANMFQASNNDVLFVVRATDQAGVAIAGTIIEVDVQYKNNPDVVPAAVSSAISSAAPGNLYFGGIDGGRLAATAAYSSFIPRI